VSKKNVDAIDEFKVNGWMLHLGFRWEQQTEYQNGPHLWVKYGHSYTQEQAIFWYRVTNPRKIWRFWL